MIETLFFQLNRTVIAVLPALDLHNKNPLAYAAKCNLLPYISL